MGVFMSVDLPNIGPSEAAKPKELTEKEKLQKNIQEIAESGGHKFASITEDNNLFVTKDPKDAATLDKIERFIYEKIKESPRDYGDLKTSFRVLIDSYQNKSTRITHSNISKIIPYKSKVGKTISKIINKINDNLYIAAFNKKIDIKTDLDYKGYIFTIRPEFQNNEIIKNFNLEQLKYFSNLAEILSENNHQIEVLNGKKEHSNSYTNNETKSIDYEIKSIRLAEIIPTLEKEIQNINKQHHNDLEEIQREIENAKDDETKLALKDKKEKLINDNRNEIKNINDEIRRIKNAEKLPILKKEKQALEVKYYKALRDIQWKIENAKSDKTKLAALEDKKKELIIDRERALKKKDKEIEKEIESIKNGEKEKILIKKKNTLSDKNARLIEALNKEIKRLEEENSQIIQIGEGKSVDNLENLTKLIVVNHQQEQNISEFPYEGYRTLKQKAEIRGRAPILSQEEAYVVKNSIQQILAGTPLSADDIAKNRALARIFDLREDLKGKIYDLKLEQLELLHDLIVSYNAKAEKYSSADKKVLGHLIEKVVRGENLSTDEIDKIQLRSHITSRPSEYLLRNIFDLRRDLKKDLEKKNVINNLKFEQLNLLNKALVSQKILNNEGSTAFYLEHLVEKILNRNELNNKEKRFIISINTIVGAGKKEEQSNLSVIEESHLDKLSLEQLKLLDGLIRQREIRTVGSKEYLILDKYINRLLKGEIVSEEKVEKDLLKATSNKIDNKHFIKEFRNFLSGKALKFKGLAKVLGEEAVDIPANLFDRIKKHESFPIFIRSRVGADVSYKEHLDNLNQVKIEPLVLLDFWDLDPIIDTFKKSLESRLGKNSASNLLQDILLDILYDIEDERKKEAVKNFKIKDLKNEISNRFIKELNKERAENLIDLKEAHEFAKGKVPFGEKEDTDIKIVDENAAIQAERALNETLKQFVDYEELEDRINDIQDDEIERKKLLQDYFHENFEYGKQNDFKAFQTVVDTVTDEIQRFGNEEITKESRLSIEGIKELLKKLKEVA